MINYSIKKFINIFMMLCLLVLVSCVNELNVTNPEKSFGGGDNEGVFQAIDDVSSSVQNSFIDINVLINDLDANGGTISLSSTTAPSHGTVVVNGDQTITYTPTAAYVGADSFTYTISDGNGGTDTETVSVTVSEVAPPDPILFLAMSVLPTSIDLNWTSGGGTTNEYILSYQSGATAPVNCSTGTIVDSINITNKTVTGLSANTQYSFRVCAKNSNTTPDISGGRGGGH